MNPKLYWIDARFPGKLAISARLRGAIGSRKRSRGGAAQASTLWSLSLPRKRMETCSWRKNPRFSRAHGIQFISLPVEDRGVPASRSEGSAVIEGVSDMLQRGRNVAVHCRQGIGRSGMIAAAVLSLRGSTPVDALEQVERARGLNVPETSEQREWVLRFANREAAHSPSLLRSRVK